MNRRPERLMVEEAYMTNPRRKAQEIAEDLGIVETMGYDRAVNYVREVKKSLRKKGKLPKPVYATDEERLQDITVLYELRRGRMSRRAAYSLLLLNCYYRLRSEDYETHMAAIDDTYAKNAQLVTPFDMDQAIRLCGVALEQYTRSLEGNGVNYTDDGFINALEITTEELAHMESIKRG